MRYLLYLLWFFVTLVVLCLLGLTLLLTVFSDEVEAKLVEKIELSTGRNIEIQGGLGFRFTPRPTFFARDIKMANAEWGSQPWMLSIDKLQASLSVMRLLEGEFSLSRIEATRPQWLIEHNETRKQNNWAFNRPREPKAFKSLAEHLRIAEVLLHDAQIRLELGPKKHLVQLDEVAAKTNLVSRTIDLSGQGRLHDKPLTFSASLGNLRSMLLREPSTLSLSGKHGETKFNAQGEVKDLLRWQGHQLALIFSTPSLKDLQPWLSSRLIDTPKINATAVFVQEKKWSSAQLDDIEIQSEALLGHTSLRGRVDYLQGLRGIVLDGMAQYPLSEILHWKGISTETDAQIKARFSLQGDKNDKLSLNVLSASLMGSGLDWSAEGNIEHILNPNTEGIRISGSAASLSDLGRITAKKWLKSDRIDGEFLLSKKDGRLSIYDISMSAFKGRAKISGLLDDIAGQRLGRYVLNAKLLPRDVQRINALNKKKFPAFELNDIHAVIESVQTKFSTPDMQLNLKNSGLQFDARGSVDDLKILKLSGLPLKLKADSSAALNQQFGLSLPEFGAISGTGVLKGSLNNSFNINDINLISNNKFQSITARGKADNLSQALSARFNIEAKITDLSNLPSMMGSDLKFSGSTRGTANAVLTSSSLNDWSLSGFSANLSEGMVGEVRGSVLHFPKAAEIAMHIDISKISKEVLLQWPLFEKLSPDGLRIAADIQQSSGQDALLVDNIDAQFTLAEKRGEVNLSGSVGDLKKMQGIDLNANISTTDLGQMPYLSKFGLKPNLTGQGAVRLSGHIDELDIDIQSLRLDTSDIKGLIHRSKQDKLKPLITGKLTANNIDILSLIAKTKRTRLFSDQKLSLDWLNRFDAEISLRAKRLNGALAQIDNADIDVSLKDGLLNIPNMHGAVGEGGSLNVWLTIATAQQPYNIISTIQGKNIKPEHINLFGKTELFRGGVVDIDIGLGGIGDSLANYMDNAYGKIQLQLHNSSLKNEKIELFGADLITGVLNVINPFTKQAEFLPIECGVIHFPVVKGDAVASQGIAIKTDKVTVLGGGGVDLGAEELQLLIKPKARKGLGFSAGTIANIAKITGNFANPSIQVDSASFIKSTAAIGAAIASGGWTLLAQGLLDRTKANSDVCTETINQPNKLTILKRAENAFQFQIGDSER